MTYGKCNYSAHSDSINKSRPSKSYPISHICIYPFTLPTTVHLLHLQPNNPSPYLLSPLHPPTRPPYQTPTLFSRTSSLPSAPCPSLTPYTHPSPIHPSVLRPLPSAPSSAPRQAPVSHSVAQRRHHSVAQAPQPVPFPHRIIPRRRRAWHRGLSRWGKFRPRARGGRAEVRAGLAC